VNIYIDKISESLGLNPITNYFPNFDINCLNQAEPFKDNVVRGSAHPCYNTTISENHKEIIRKRQTGRQVSKSTRNKISESLKGKKASKETKKKLSEIKMGEKNHFYGKTHSVESIEKIRFANIGRKDSDETRKKKSLSLVGNSNGKNSMLGKTHSQNTINAIRNAALNRNKLECPHCKKQIAVNVANRWHFDNCKHKL
jgi:hypothetical protein